MNVPIDMKRAVIDELASARPDLWRKCYPKVYNSIPHDYASPKELAATLVGCALKIEQGFLGENEKAEIVWASKLTNLRVPLYLLTHDMAEALKLTTPPQMISLEEIKLPFEAAVFMLPKSVLVNEDANEGDALFISYVRTHVGEQIRSLASGNPEFWWPQQNGSMTIFAGTRGEHLLHWTIPNIERIDLGNLDEWIKRFLEVGFQHRSQFPQWVNEDLTPEDNRFMARVVHLLFTTLILMTARPDLVTAAALESRIHKKRETPREFWSPHVIGKNYKIRRAAKPYQGGTHASPRLHPVRGYFKPKLGARLGLVEPPWIEPYWRGRE